jgi:capsular exopolysaccharide synthesis family protein
MSRIHDAMSRAGAGPIRRVRFPASVGEVFLSPWSVPDEQAKATAVVDESADRVAAPAGPVAHVRREPVAVLDPAVPALAEQFSAEWRERIIVWPEIAPMVVEQFRRIAATLIHRQRADGLKSVMVASANAGDGKTLTALNLALVLSGSYRDRVLLIDGDLRRPSLAAAANVRGADGLNEVVKATEDRRVSVVQLTDTLALLPAGTPDDDPLSGLTSTRMERLLAEAAERFDWVIIDSPPVGATADASLLCAIVETAILVVRAGQTPHSAVQRAIDVLGRERIHGVVLNGVEDQVVRERGNYGDYVTR